RADPARSARDEDALASAHPGAVQHPLGGRIGAGNRCQFRIAPVAIHPVRLGGWRLRVLREGTVAFRAEGPAFERTIAHVGTEHVANDDALTDAARVDSRPGGHDMPAAVRSLDSRKGKWRARPTGIGCG